MSEEKKELNEAKELNDEALEDVSGGLGRRRLSTMSMLKTPEEKEYTCACAVCKTNTTWKMSLDGRSITCTVCGTSKELPSFITEFKPFIDNDALI